MDKQIIVIGAGVIGLTTALSLKQKGYQHVTIVAKYFPGNMSIEYTSPYAGAHWRSMAPNNNKLLQKFDTDSYNKFMEIAGTELKSGVMILEAYDYFENETLPEVKNPWYKDTVKNFKFIHQEFPKGAKAGHQYTTVVVNSPVYLKWLLDEFKKFGGTTLEYHLLHIDQIAHLVKEKDIYVVNCTGLGSKYLGGVQDHALTSVRGQTIIVKNAKIKKTITFVYKSGITYVIPRSDGTVILGGTNTKGDFNPFVDGSTAKSIIERTLSVCPELGKNEKDLDIVGHRVGLRPYRENGPRFDKQIKKLDNGKTLYITHSYGHGGFGFQASWGSAEHTIKLMENEMSRL